MARRRNYKAEYIARQQRSQERYGVGYSQQRRLVQQAAKQGVTASAVRQRLETNKAAGLEPTDNIKRAFDINRQLKDLNVNRRVNRSRMDALISEFMDIFPDDDYLEFLRYRD